TSLKRYRYTSKERDEESGLYYHGARYYASWLGRWTTCDPAGMVDGSNLYRYARANPIHFIDVTGNDAESPVEFSKPLPPEVEREIEERINKREKEEKYVREYKWRFIKVRGELLAEELVAEGRLFEGRKVAPEVELLAKGDLAKGSVELGERLELYGRVAGAKAGFEASPEEGLDVGAEAYLGAVGAKLRLFTMLGTEVSIKAEAKAGAGVGVTARTGQHGAKPGKHLRWRKYGAKLGPFEGALELEQKPKEVEFSSAEARRLYQRYKTGKQNYETLVRQAATA